MTFIKRPVLHVFRGNYLEMQHKEAPYSSHFMTDIVSISLDSCSHGNNIVVLFSLFFSIEQSWRYQFEQLPSLLVLPLRPLSFLLELPAPMTKSFLNKRPTPKQKCGEFFVLLPKKSGQML